METMKVPNIMLKVLSKIIGKKITDKTGTKVAVDLSQLDVISGDNATTVGIHLTVTAENSEIPKMLKQLGIM